MAFEFILLAISLHHVLRPIHYAFVHYVITGIIVLYLACCLYSTTSFTYCIFINRNERDSQILNLATPNGIKVVSIDNTLQRC